jgi:hypothetical protein
MTAEAVTRTLRKACATFSDSECAVGQNDAGKILACPSWALEVANTDPSL